MGTNLHSFELCAAMVSAAAALALLLLLPKGLLLTAGGPGTTGLGVLYSLNTAVVSARQGGRLLQLHDPKLLVSLGCASSICLADAGHCHVKSASALEAVGDLMPWQTTVVVIHTAACLMH